MTTTDPDARHRSWWTTVPGVLTAFAAIITATGGLIAVLVQGGLLGGANQRLSDVSSESPRSIAETRPGSGPPERTTSAPQGSTQAARPATVAPTRDLRPQGFRGVSITLLDGSVVTLQRDVLIYGIQYFQLRNGQTIEFDRISSVEIRHPWDGRVRFTLLNDQQLEAELSSDVPLWGKNELGTFTGYTSKMQRIDFLR
jgi:hypothetical protein